MRRIVSVTALVLLMAAPAGAELRVGVAKADVTPPPGVRMYGYGARGEHVSTGVHDPLYAKAIVLTDGQRTAAWVTMDLGYADKPLTRDIRAAVSAALGFDDVFLTSSHTHSGPTFVPDFPSAANPWIQELRRKVTAAIVEAHGALQPARLGVGWGRVDLGHNRRRVRADGTVEMLWENRRGIPTSPVDKSVAVVAFDTPAGEPIATLVNLAIHPVVLGPENLEYSADYPGAMMAVVERGVGGQAMFLQGAAGDINPFWDKTSLADGAYEQMRSMGETIGAEVVRVRKELLFADVDSIALGVERVQISPRWDIDDPAIRAGVRRDYVERFGREGEAEVKTLLIGSDLALASFPGEFFVEHGLRLKDESVVINTLFVGYSNGHLGYFPTIKAAAQGGYGAGSSTIVEVGAGELLVNRALINLAYLSGQVSRTP
ncbi:MAG: neutral/alkaline non-lysosomal ceramidase N-terminal domain-containing protein [Acidobacteria bacterium]|nr:neutral/alkaline non-lysosomal ceramidase N-terminal domain-containing protein [Acidobacteriota bacterium]